MEFRTLKKQDYVRVARQMAAEGCVLLENREQALPLRSGDQVAVFGRCADYYYKSGLGSGGLVNTNYVVSILDALREREEIRLNEELMQIYEVWEQENPIDRGNGWGEVPWSQKEMPITPRMLEIAGESDVSLLVIGRTAGEDQDNRNEPGSFLLTDTEKELIEKVSRVCPRTVVLLNVGNIIDMKWIKDYDPAAIMYVWQGGQEGGHGVADVLMGEVSPSGKLPATIAVDLADYPSTANFGNEDGNVYAEDIYVGYRYFETFARDRVLFPFGAGMSYTDFSIQGTLVEQTQERITVSVTAQNTGNVSGKEAVLLYVEAPQALIGKPDRVLIGFAKTGVLAPGEQQELTISCAKSVFATYDEVGVSGHRNAWILEEGTYRLLVGGDIRSAQKCGEFMQSFRVVEQLEEACAPRESFERMVRSSGADGRAQLAWEPCAVEKDRVEKRMQQYAPEEIIYTGDQGYRLADVYENRITMEQFVAQLDDENLIGLFHGEGMCSNKVTPGTAGAFSGVPHRLQEFGIPAVCCADGPSGIRMDCGTKAFSVANGAAIGSSFNEELAQELFRLVGLEMRKNKVDTLLGPGINILRNPLNGRNFEYFSEDPLLTGKMCAAQLKGLEQSGVTGTIKHYCCNEQEQYRTRVNAVVSQRALREIYLRAFEIGVREGKAKSIMSSYNPVNGIWSAGNFDLCTTILRKEWNYDGIVMTDWWACANWEGEPAEWGNRAPMVRAQNDIFMCSASSQTEIEADNVLEKLKEGRITRAQLQRNACNILGFTIQTPAMLRQMGIEGELELEGFEDEQEEDTLLFDMERYESDPKTGIVEINRDDVIEAEAGKSVLIELVMDQEGVDITKGRVFELVITMSSPLKSLAQLPVSIYTDNIYRMTLSMNGTEGCVCEVSCEIGPIIGRIHYLKLVFGADGMDITRIRMTPVKYSSH